jgi:hypothetical protein
VAFAKRWGEAAGIADASVRQTLGWGHHALLAGGRRVMCRTGTSQIPGPGVCCPNQVRVRAHCHSISTARNRNRNPPHRICAGQKAERGSAADGATPQSRTNNARVSRFISPGWAQPFAAAASGGVGVPEPGTLRDTAHQTLGLKPSVGKGHTRWRLGFGNLIRVEVRVVAGLPLERAEAVER